MPDDLNHHTDGSALAESARQANQPGALTSITAVEDILRGFTDAIVGRLDSVSEGRLTPNDASKADHQECLRLGKVFAGGDPSHPAPGDWNAGGGLAAYLRRKMPAVAGASDAEVVANAFAVFVHNVYDQFRDADADADKARAALLENIRSFTWALIGLDTDD